MADTIVHFEIPANDPEAMMKFYGDCFGWKFKKGDVPGIEYWLVVYSIRRSEA